MNEKVLKTLEYDKIIEMLAEKANSAPGKKLCRELVPSTDLEEIRKNQRHTADALRRLFRFGSTSFGNNKDISFSVRSLQIGSTLSIPELLNIAAMLDKLPPIRQYDPEPAPQPQQLEGKRDFRIRAEDGIYIVEADWLMSALGMVDMEDYESLQYFQRVLIKSGIIEELERMGIREGDTVSILNFEFDYIK